MRHSGVMECEAPQEDRRCEAVRTLRPSGDDGLEDDVRRAQAGDIESFERLYRATAGRIFALCLRICGNQSRAEDLTQDVYIRAWRKLTSFRGDSAFSSWLYRLAVNVVYSDLRRTRTSRQWDALPGTDELGELTRSSLHPLDSLALEQAIAGLPDGARAVLVLHDMEGFQHQEIADRLGIAVGTSKAQLHRARRILRKVV